MTPIAHAAVGLVGWKYFSRGASRRSLVFFIVAACAVDLDFLLYYTFGKPQVFLHQLYSHNIFISLAIVLPFFPFLKSVRERLGLVAVAFSHLFLDLFVIDTVPPIGFRPFFPVYNRFFSYGFFPYVARSNLTEVFSLHNLFTVGLEVVVFAIPALFLCRKELASLRPRAAIRPAE